MDQSHCPHGFCKLLLLHYKVSLGFGRHGFEIHRPSIPRRWNRMAQARRATLNHHKTRTPHCIYLIGCRGMTHEPGTFWQVFAFGVFSFLVFGRGPKKAGTFWHVFIACKVSRGDRWHVLARFRFRPFVFSLPFSGERLEQKRAAVEIHRPPGRRVSPERSP